MRLYEIATGEMVDQIFSNIERDCSDAISAFKATGKLLYRGVKLDKLVNGPYDIVFRTTRNDRLPKDTQIDKSELADEWFKKHGFTAYRSNSVFATAYSQIAQTYGGGYDGVYICIPSNTASITWSPIIMDFWRATRSSTYTDKDQIDRFMSVAKYQNHDLIGAINSKHEIMISGQYVLINYLEYAQLFCEKIGIQYETF